MADPIRFNVYASVHDGKLEQFKRVAKDMITKARAEDHGTLSYEWFFTSEDESAVQVLEVFENSEALLAYFKRGEADEKGHLFLETCDVTKIEICGNASEALREKAESWGFEIDYYHYLDGFTR